MLNDEIFEKGIKYEIFIGTRDKDSYEELIGADECRRILSEICAERKIGFSLLTQLGGYSHNMGYTTETSMRVVVIGEDEDEIIRLGERLKQEINTDTILITKSDVEYAFV